MPYETFIGWRYLRRRREPFWPLVLAVDGFANAAVGLLANLLGSAPWLAWAYLVKGLVQALVCAGLATGWILRRKKGSGWLIGLCITGLLDAGAAALALRYGSSGWWAFGLFVGGATQGLFFSLLAIFSVFVTLSIVGVVFGVAALTGSLAITSGFQREFQDKLLGVNAHILVMKYGLDFREYRDVMKTALGVPGVEAASPFVFNEMMLSRGSSMAGVLIKGIDPELASKVLDLPRHLKSGKPTDLRSALPPGKPAGPPPPQGDGETELPTIFIGEGLASKLKAKRGDVVRVVAPQTGLDSGADATPPSRDFRVAGIFFSGFDEYDRRLVYIHFREAQRFYYKDDMVSGVELRVDDIYKSGPIQREIEKRLGGSPYRTIDWRELNKNLFSALRMQKLTLAIVITFMILVAASNIISSLTMVVIAKYREIAILKSMGASSFGILRIFLASGIGIGVVGAPLGIALGLGVCFSLQKFIKLDPRVYLITGLPVKLAWPEMLLAAGVAVLLCFGASLLPSWRASRLRPVDGLRYE